jgi:hypothetical protein
MAAKRRMNLRFMARRVSSASTPRPRATFTSVNSRSPSSSCRYAGAAIATQLLSAAHGGYDIAIQWVKLINPQVGKAAEDGWEAARVAVA